MKRIREGDIINKRRNKYIAAFHYVDQFFLVLWVAKCFIFSTFHFYHSKFIMKFVLTSNETKKYSQTKRNYQNDGKSKK